MIVDKLVLKNFRKYESLELDFENRLSVIVGKNRSGKTSIMDAISFSLNSFVSALLQKRTTIPCFDKSSVRYIQNNSMGTLETYPCFPLEVYTEGMVCTEKYGKDENLLIINNNDSEQKQSALGADILEQLKANVFSDNLPLIAYYDISRNNREAMMRKEINTMPSRLNGYEDCLYAPLNSGSMTEWIKKATYVGLQRQIKVPTLQSVLKALEKTVEILMSVEKVEAFYDVNNDDLCVIDTVADKLTFMRSESAGFKTIVYIVLDIAYRMATLNPQLGDKVIEETDGIVLIDEVDLHLHPEWQQKILGVLTTVFPKVQFIVTTHAPAIINSVKSESLIILEDDKAYGPDGEVYGKDVNTIIMSVMDTTERPEKIKNLFEEFYCLLDDEKFDDAKNKISEIENEIGSDDPELTSCKVKLKFALM